MKKSFLARSQNEYLILLQKYRGLFKKRDIQMTQVAMFLDDIRIFWLKRLPILRYEFHNITTNTQCFVLSGAIYLNVMDNENFYFKSMGEQHIIIDPFLKLETFFRIDETRVDSKETINLMRRTFEDTVSVLEEYPDQFYILPLTEMAWETKDDLFELLNKFFWRFLSEAFRKEITSECEFGEQYTTYEEIEENIDDYFLSNLILTDNYDSKMSLRDRINKYISNQFAMPGLTMSQTEPQIFVTIVFSQVSQIIDILLTCASLNLSPYIRQGVTMRYLLLLMGTFIEDHNTKEMIEKTIIFYIFHEHVDAELFNGMNFLEYCDRSSEVKLLDRIMHRLRERNIDITSQGVKELIGIIEEEFPLLLKGN